MHRCVRCGNIYEDMDATILRGCTGCGSIFFLYTKGADDINVRMLDAVKEELKKKDTTLEQEVIRQIEQKKSERAKGKEEEEAGASAETPVEVEVVEGPEFVELVPKGEALKEEKEETEKIKKVRKLKRATKAARATKKKMHAKKKLKEEKEKKEAAREVMRVGKEKFGLERDFGVEAIRMPKEGVYEINIDALMKKQPVIVLERGQIYVIHLPDVFESVGKK